MYKKFPILREMGEIRYTGRDSMADLPLWGQIV